MKPVDEFSADIGKPCWVVFDDSVLQGIVKDFYKTTSSSVDYKVSLNKNGFHIWRHSSFVFFSVEDVVAYINRKTERLSVELDKWDKIRTNLINAEMDRRFDEKAKKVQE